MIGAPEYGKADEDQDADKCPVHERTPFPDESASIVSRPVKPGL